MINKKPLKRYIVNKMLMQRHILNKKPLKMFETKKQTLKRHKYLKIMRFECIMCIRDINEIEMILLSIIFFAFQVGLDIIIIINIIMFMINK